MSDRPGFSFLLCPDPELIKLELQNLSAAYEANYSKRLYWADEELPDSFWQDLTTLDLMGNPRLVIVRRAHSFLKEIWDKLVPVLSGYSSGIWPVFCLESDPDKKGKITPPKVLEKQPYYKIARDRGWIWINAGLNAGTMPDFIRNYSRRANVTFAPHMQETLIKILPYDALAAKNELDKLALAAGDKALVTPEHLSLITHQTDMDIFAFIRAVMDGKNKAQVWKKVFENSLVASSDNILFSFLALFIREARILWELYHDETPSSWVHPAEKTRKRTLAKKLGTLRLGMIWDMVLTAEMSIKSGQRTPEQAFESLVSELYTLFHGKGKV